MPGDPAPKLYGADDGDLEGAVGEQALVDGAFTDLAREQAATDAVFAGYADLGARVGRDRSSVRELWVHRIEEYARHCGHADLLRERIDGRVGQWRAAYVASVGATVWSARRSSPAVSTA